MCYCYHSTAVVVDEGRACAVGLNCNGWECPDCGPRRLEMWRARARRLSDRGGLFESTVCSTKKELASFQRKLRRWGCLFFRVVTSAGYEVFHQSESGFSGSALMEFVNDVLGRVRSVLGQKRMGSSKELMAASIDGRKWELASKTGLSIEEMDRRVKSAGRKGLRFGRLFPVEWLVDLVGDGFELSARVLSAICGKKQIAARTSEDVEGGATVLGGSAAIIF